MLNKKGESIWKRCKVLTEWSPDSQKYEFIDCKQILHNGMPCSLDMIRCDTGERVYFVGMERGSCEFVWVVEKYTEVKDVKD